MTNMKQELTLTERLKQVQGALSYVVERVDFTFAECSEAETIWNKAKESLALMPSIIAEVERLSERQDQLQYIAKSLHYPECWDTMAYPTIWDAIIEMAACSECSDGKQFKLTAEPTEGEIEAGRQAIDAVSKEDWHGNVEYDSLAFAKAALTTFLEGRRCPTTIEKGSL